jgi:hypothetical protein
MTEKPNAIDQPISFFEKLKEALEECIAHERGEIKLRVVHRSCPPPDTDAENVFESPGDGSE